MSGGVVKHGTRSGYTAGCRCEACTLANRLYQREYMRRYYGTEHYKSLDRAKKRRRRQRHREVAGIAMPDEPQP